jgi:sugar lactone lactonase YvrE
MTTARNQGWTIVPGRAVEGGSLTVDAPSACLTVDPVPAVLLGGVPARVVTASSRRLTVIVPAGMDGGRVPLVIDGVDDPVGFVEVGVRQATGLHQVDSPVFDAQGNLYTTFSGSRGQQVPVSVFRVRPDGTREAVVSGIANATSLAFDPFGDLCVSSRFDGAVYRVRADGTLDKVASDLGVACGLQFTPDGSMLVGDRSGTIFRVSAAGRVTPFAMLPPSVAAFHLALGPDEALYVSAPTLSTHDVIYRIDHRGTVSVFAEGFGRPQGLAFDRAGVLHVAEAAAGTSGLYRVRPGGVRELLVTGVALVGVAFHPAGGVAVTSADTAYWFDDRTG